jgi:glycerophosphoryl diester phosphodiesterase
MRVHRLLSFAVLIALAFLVAGCATTGPGAPRGQVAVIAHRGASHDAPENTLAAFRLAHEMGADWFELDCRLTRDNVVIVMHDDTLERTAGVEGRVADFDFAELRKLDAGRWKDPRFAGEMLPTLEEALETAKKRIGVYVEIKNMEDDTALMARLLQTAAETPVMTPLIAKRMILAIEESGTRNLALTRNTIAVIRALRMEKEVVIQSFSPVICAVARIEAPDLRVELLSGVEQDDSALWEQVCRWVFLLDLHGLNLNAKGITPGRLATIQGAGKTVAVWTVNHPGDMKTFAYWGVNALITDRPDLCLNVLGRSVE